MRHRSIRFPCLMPTATMDSRHAVAPLGSTAIHWKATHGWLFHFPGKDHRMTRSTFSRMLLVAAALALAGCNAAAPTADTSSPAAGKMAAPAAAGAFA